MNSVGEVNFYSEFDFRTSRSSGKGGQNVNKVSSKVELIFNVLNSKLLTHEQKQVLCTKLSKKINAEGFLQIFSDTDRSQLRNKEIAIKKFYKLIEAALKPEKVRKKLKQSRASKQRRLTDKKRNSEKKETRSKKIDY